MLGGASLRRRSESGDRKRPFSQRTLIHLSRRRSVSASVEINPTTYDQMLIVMKPGATASEIDAVVNVVEAVGFRAHPMPGATRTAIGITGNEGPVDGRRFENLAGVAEVIRVTKPYKLVTLDLRPDKTVVSVGDAAIGDSELAIIAGPCAIESREQAFAIAKIVQQSGARFFRGCVWKPRTSPYTFQGLGDKGWEIMSAVREEFGLEDCD